MKAKIDLEKFICSYVKWNNIQDALKDQGLKCWNGEIIEIPQENENEKIRKEHISFVGHDGWKFIKEEKESMIDCLEKQDKPIDKEKVMISARKNIALSIMNFLYMNTPGMCLSNIEFKDLEDAVVNSDWSKVYNYMKKKLESKGEQKLIDKFEPKFHQGDWVVFIASGSVYQVEKIENYEYTLRHILDDSFRMWLSFSDEKFIREWTINDAKDGDVLACGVKVTDCPFIFHNLTKELCPRSYCGVNTLGHFQDNDENGGFWCDSKEVRPATKEQRDLLFTKMKEAGWEWDDKKKELKKIRQKSTDKIEPKFHQGDWTVSNLDGKARQISEVHFFEYNSYYVVDENPVNLEEYDRLHHLWTIQDAKDGDAVVDKSDGTIGIFQSIGHQPDGGSYNDPSYCFLHCRYDDGFFYADFENGNTMNSDDVIPATKEQRDLLFKKMKEAGYEWDADKKELKKIPNAVEKCEIENVEHGKYYYCIKDYYAGGNKRASEGDVVQALNGMSMMALGVKANEYFIPVNTIKQKSVWSEEDERMLHIIIADFKGFIRDNTSTLESHFNECIDWLKSLKGRVQTQNRWKPSKDHIIALRWVLNNIPYNKHKEEISGLLDQIKDL